MSQKRGLGRGLESLIPVADRPSSGYSEVGIEEIRPNPQQPRISFDQEALQGLAESIKTVGLLQPIVVRPDPEGGFVLVAGERRWRAAKLAGLQRLPAVIRETEDSESLSAALVENLQRADLSPLEEAAAFKQLLEDFGLTHEEVGERVGRSRAAVTNSIRLLGLPASIQARIANGELSAGAARALAAIDDRAFAEHVAKRAAAEGWSVRQVEEAVRLRRGDTGERRPGQREARPAEIIELEARLADRLGQRVKVDFRDGRGALRIDYASLEELEKVYRRLMA